MLVKNIYLVGKNGSLEPFLYVRQFYLQRLMSSCRNNTEALAKETRRQGLFMRRVSEGFEGRKNKENRLYKVDKSANLNEAIKLLMITVY